MKRLLFILICCLSFLIKVAAQNTLPFVGDTTKSLKIQKYLTLKGACVILQKTYDSNLRKAAFEIVIKYAKEGNPEAMHAMGMVYYTGMSVNRDFDVARKWFELADAKGYAKSAYNLCSMYRLGVGVPQDFGKAYYYAGRSASGGFSQAIYAQGYLLYKGLGCTQSYGEALNYFKDAANQNHGYAMYMIGLCYRNGYGVARDNGEANYWLGKAATKGIKWAADELNTDSPENIAKPTKIRGVSAKTTDLPDIFQCTKHQVSALNPINGGYNGSLVTYDWSGQHVIKEVPLQVTIEQYGNQITAYWKEDTLSIVEAKGILTDTALVFTQATYSKLDHYHSIVPVVWNFLKAKLKTIQKGDTIYLAGNLQLYSPDTKEPGKPMYLSMQTKQSATAAKTTASFVADTNKSPMVYPNPFNGELFVSFYLENKASCSITVSTMNGTIVYQEPLGELTAGAQRYQMQLDLPSASYLVKLMYGDKVYNSVIIKKNNI